MDESLKQKRMKLITKHKRILVVRIEMIAAMKKTLKEMEEKNRQDYKELFGEEIEDDIYTTISADKSDKEFLRKLKGRRSKWWI